MKFPRPAAATLHTIGQLSSAAFNKISQFRENTGTIRDVLNHATAGTAKAEVGHGEFRVWLVKLFARGTDSPTAVRAKLDLIVPRQM